MKQKEEINFCTSVENDGTTSAYHRSWLPLDFLNCISILRQHGFKARLVRPSDLNSLSPGSILILSGGSIDRWFSPSIRLNSLFEICHQYASKLKIYVAGLHATLFPDYFRQRIPVTGVLEGMPEAAVLDFCRTGTWRRQRHAMQDLAMYSWPLPAYDQVSAQDFIFEPMGWKNFGVFEMGRGCHQNCSFCAKNFFYGTGYKYKSPRQLAEELVCAHHRHGFQSGYFMDICFLSDRPLAEEFCHLLKREKLNFVWACETRAQDLDEGMVELMYEAGCRMIGMGICSFFDFKNHKYGFNEKMYCDKINMVETKGIRTLGYFIVSPLFSSYASYDDDVLNVVKRMPLTFANIRRYLDFHDPSWLLREIQKDVPYRQDFLDKAIASHMLRFYLNPARCVRIFRQVGARRILRSARFLSRFLRRE